MRARFNVIAFVIAFGGMIAWLPAVALGQDPGNRLGRPAAVEKTTAVRGDPAAGVSATGTLEPQEVVDVGSQVDGRIVSLGNDPSGAGKAIDFNAKVAKGDVLAKIDDAIYVSRLEAARARLQLAQAQVALAEAKLRQAAADFQRVQSVAKTGAISQAELDTAKGGEQAARAGVEVAAAEVAVQKATLIQAEIDLDRTTIRSPIQGVIIDRRVNVGQVVGSQANAAGMFLIAADLKKLEIWAAVGEADIARVHVGQPAQFTVDAYPGKTFEGRVRQIRLNAQSTQNRVTFTTVISVDNAEEKLLPYMTAAVRFAPDKADGQ